MKKTKITATEFGKIVEETPASKFDCGMTHIYISTFSDDTLSFLKEYISSLSAEKLLSCMVYWNDRVETLCNFGEEYFIY